MARLRNIFPTLLPLLLLLIPFSTAQRSPTDNNTGAVFVYNGSDDNSVTFALNADAESGDLYFHLASPQQNTWVGVGIGVQMAGALMFIAYPGDDVNNVTISPRMGTGHTEPAFTSDAKVQLVTGEGLTGANTVGGDYRDTQDIVVDAVCSGCAKLPGVSLDLTSKTQPFIFAVGPVFPGISSNSPSAGLSRHAFYGQFTMDMTAATSQTSGAAVPIGPYLQKDASEAYNTNVDNDPAPHIHGLVMSLVFIIILPLGALLLRVWHKVKGHIIVQTIGLVLFCMAFAGGCVVSTFYIRSKSFNSAHQVIGILLLLAMLSQYALGVVHHRIFKREQRKTTFAKVHRILGPVIIFFGIVNGGLGFRLGGAAFLALPYAVIIILLCLLYLCISGATLFYRRRRGTKQGGGVTEGYAYPSYGGPAPTFGPAVGANSGANGFNASGYPPAGYPPPYSQHDVPLTRMESGQSVPRAEDPAVEARPMV